MLKLLNALLHLAKGDLMFEERGYLVDRNLWQKLFEEQNYSVEKVKVYVQ